MFESHLAPTSPETVLRDLSSFELWEISLERSRRRRRERAAKHRKETPKTRGAAAGMSDRSSGPQLHFETRVNGRPQDPVPYLNR